MSYWLSREFEIKYHWSPVNCWMYLKLDWIFLGEEIILKRYSLFWFNCRMFRFAILFLRIHANDRNKTKYIHSQIDEMRQKIQFSEHWKPNSLWTFIEHLHLFVDEFILWMTCSIICSGYTDNITMATWQAGGRV